MDRARKIATRSLLYKEQHTRFVHLFSLVTDQSGPGNNQGRDTPNFGSGIVEVAHAEQHRLEALVGRPILHWVKPEYYQGIELFPPR